MNNIRINEIYTKYYDSVYYFIIKKIGSNEVTEELTNDVFLAVNNHISEYDEKIAKLNTWLLSIANRKVIDYYRSKTSNKQTKTTYVDSFCDEDGFNTYEFNSDVLNPFDSLLNKELSEKINYSLMQLHEKYRTIALMNIVEGMKYEEIANILQIPINTIKTRIARAKQQLQESLSSV